MEGKYGLKIALDSIETRSQSKLLTVYHQYLKSGKYQLINASNTTHDQCVLWRKDVDNMADLFTEVLS